MSNKKERVRQRLQQLEQDNIKKIRKLTEEELIEALTRARPVQKRSWWEDAMYKVFPGWDPGY